MAISGEYQAPAIYSNFILHQYHLHSMSFQGQCLYHPQSTTSFISNRPRIPLPFNKEYSIAVEHFCYSVTILGQERRKSHSGYRKAANAGKISLSHSFEKYTPSVASLGMHFHLVNILNLLKVAPFPEG